MLRQAEQDWGVFDDGNWFVVGLSGRAAQQTDLFHVQMKLLVNSWFLYSNRSRCQLQLAHCSLSFAPVCVR